MTTDQIKKQVSVNIYTISDTGLFITYHINKTAETHSIEHYRLSPIQTLHQLERIGSIRRFEVNPIKVYWESIKGAAVESDWEQFHQLFTLSQHEALSLVIRHEYEKSLESDMNLLEIDKALEALK